METWGSEFCDDGAYGAMYAPVVFDGKELFVPLTLLDRIVDPSYINEIRVSDKQKLMGLTSSMSINGQIDAGSLNYDSKTIRLREGHHRYLAAHALGWETLRVRLRKVSYIGSPGLPLEQVLPDLMHALFSASGSRM